jgi:RNA polymerase sigma factor (sigma-70 family)
VGTVDVEGDVLPGLQRELGRFALRLTGDPDLAEDAVQEAMVRLLEAGGVDSVENPRAWLHRVTLNVVRDHARRRETAQRLQPPPPESGPPTPDEDFERSESVRQVRRVLQQLSSRDRELLIMRESGFRYREIAEVIGVKAESVATLARRALARFQDAYEAEMVDDTPR